MASMRYMSRITKRLRLRATIKQKNNCPSSSEKKIQRNMKIKRMLDKAERKPYPMLKSFFVYQTYTVRLAKKPIVMPKTAPILRYVSFKKGS